MAAVSVANIVKSSLGPVGLDKMLVDDVGVRTFSVSICVLVESVKYPTIWATWNSLGVVLVGVRS